MRLEFESNVSTPSLNENGTADSVSENASSQVKAFLHDGIKAAQAGNRAEARHLLLRVTELDQKNESAWLWLASISEYPEELLIFLNNVLDVNPENQRALEWMKATKSLLAKTFVQRGIDAHREEQFSFAKQCFFQAVGHDDQNEMAWLWLASVSDLAEEKKSYLDKVLAINPDNEDAKTALESANFGIAQNLCKKANGLAAVGKNDEAAELLEEIFQKAPNLEDAWLLKAHLSPSFDEKFRCFEKVIELNAHNETALAGLDAFRTITQITAPQVHFEESFVSEEKDVQTDFSPEPSAPSFAEENFSPAEFQFEEKTEVFVEESFSEPVEEKTEEVQEVQEEFQFAPEFTFDNSPTDELELPEAFAVSNPFENRHASSEDRAIHEEIDSFFDALEESKKADENEEVKGAVEKENFELFADENAQTETAIELADEQTVVESFTPRHSFDDSEEAEETVQFSEGVENDDFEIAEESGETEASQPQLSQTQEEENLYFQEPETAEPAQEFHQEETAQFEETAHFEETTHEEASFETQPTESHNLSDNYSYQNFAHNVETQESEEFAQPVEETHSEETYQTEAHENAQEVAPEPFFAEEEVQVEESKAEFVKEQTEEVSAEEAQQEEPQQFFEEETQAEEVQFEAEEFHAEVVETVFEETVEEVKVETTACPYCSAENEVQAFACGSCRAVLSLSDLEVLLSNNEANEVLLHQAVSRMELEKNLRPFDAEELLYLGIGYVNLKNLRQGFAYLQEAAQMRPDDFLLNSQVNALAIRVEDIKKQEEAHDAQPKGRTILVVDDSATVRKLISGKLEKCGHEVVCAVDGMDALAKLNEIVPDLILLDITMPRMDGYQVCKLIRNNQATKDIPVVMISGKDGFFDKVRGRMAGTTGYITKPFGPETLMKALDAYIRNGN